MKIKAWILASALTLCTLPAQAAIDNDVDAITSVVMHYFEGVKAGDEEQLKKAFFHSSMDMKGLLSVDGKPTLLALSDSDAFKDLSSRPNTTMTGRILSINIYHPKAAFVTFDFNNQFVDGFQLLKTAGEWRILNKTFVAK